MFEMYNVVPMSYEERVYMFARDNYAGGKKPVVLLNKYGLQFRKNKTEVDVIKAKKTAMLRNKDTDAFLMDYAQLLQAVLKLVK